MESGVLSLGVLSVWAESAWFARYELWKVENKSAILWHFFASLGRGGCGGGVEHEM